jgi:hypothetical protein
MPTLSYPYHIELGDRWIELPPRLTGWDAPKRNTMGQNMVISGRLNDRFAFYQIVMKTSFSKKG